MGKVTKKCFYCNIEFVTGRTNKIFCNSRCQWNYARERNTSKVPKVHELNCPKCYKTFMGSDSRAYCPDCKRASKRKIFVADWANISTSALGTMNELVVAVDLMKKGFEVYCNFRHSGSHDLIALKMDKIYRIEIKTVRLKSIESIPLIPKKCKELLRLSKIDYFVAVTQRGIFYYPTLEI